MLAPALLRTHVSLSTYKMAGVSVLAGDVSRTWLVEDAEGKSHEVQLYHNTVSGARSLLVDGEEEAGTSGTTTMFTATEALPYTIGDRSGLVRITCNKKVFQYACDFHGISQQEENQRLVNVPDIAPIETSIPETCVSKPSSGDVRALGRYAAARDCLSAGFMCSHMRTVGCGQVVWYLIKSHRPEDGRVNEVHRRFSDFFGIHEQIRRYVTDPGVGMRSRLGKCDHRGCVLVAAATRAHRF